MKFFIVLVSVFLSMSASAGEQNVLAGQYASCVRWTTMMGIETSKKFEFVFSEDSSLHLRGSYYEGSAVCEGEPKEVREYTKFVVLEDSGNRVVRIITAQDEESKRYFKFILSKTYATVNTGDALPVKADPMRTLILDRVK